MTNQRSDPWAVQFTYLYLTDALPFEETLKAKALAKGGEVSNSYKEDWTVEKPINDPRAVVYQVNTIWFTLPTKIQAARFACDVLMAHDSIIAVNLNPDDD